MATGCTTTIVVGNGIGMAINSTSFTIESGLKDTWSKLDADLQDRIKSLITGGGELISEQQLDSHYEVIQSCLSLRRFEKSNPLPWLDPKARDFPEKFNSFVKDVGWYFFRQSSSSEKLSQFIDALCGYILNNNKTHLVTLNYDKLLYDYLCNDSRIMKGFSGRLVDGFFVESTGFNPSNLECFNKDIGWYLHLHGSPLFYTNAETGIINKSSFKNIYFEDNDDYVREHLILCNTSLKPTHISQSALLYWYWNYFKVALNQSSKIILLGYSGNDKHVNAEIINAINKNSEINIIIVEYKQPNLEKNSRIQFWNDRLKFNNDSHYQIKLFNSILDFKFDIEK